MLSSGERPRSVLETPLNWIFSSEANVRILRELALSKAPLSKSEIARRTGISLPGVLKALPRLFDTGLVAPVGTGSRQVFAMREKHPLVAFVEFLFRAEALRKQELTAELSRLFGAAERPIRSAWLHEPERTPSAPVAVCVLVNSADVSQTQDALHPELAELSERFGVALELFVWTVPDIVALSPEQREWLEHVVPLHGPNPLTTAPDSKASAKAERQGRTHAVREAQSIRRALWVVRMLDHDPALPERASTWIVHRLHTASPRESADLKEWLYLLRSSPISTLQYVLLRVDERSNRLRQTNPFIMALSRQERARMVEETEP